MLLFGAGDETPTRAEYGMFLAHSAALRLVKRPDAGTCLIKAYESMTSENQIQGRNTLEKSRYIVMYINVELLLSQPEVISRMNHDEKMRILILCQRKLSDKMDNIETYRPENIDTSAYLIANILLDLKYAPFMNDYANDPGLQTFSRTGSFCSRDMFGVIM
jgi:hypothetical protein